MGSLSIKEDISDREDQLRSVIASAVANPHVTDYDMAELITGAAGHVRMYLDRGQLTIHDWVDDQIDNDGPYKATLNIVVDTEDPQDPLITIGYRIKEYII